LNDEVSRLVAIRIFCHRSSHRLLQGCAFDRFDRRDALAAIEKSLALTYQTPTLAALQEGVSGISGFYKYKPAEKGVAAAVSIGPAASALGKAALSDLGLKCSPPRRSFKLFAETLRQRLVRWHALDPDRAAP
jgi:hypothetical protein